jgi:hypothetical protein
MRERIQLRMNEWYEKQTAAVTVLTWNVNNYPSVLKGRIRFFHIEEHACSMSITVLLKPRKLYQSGMLQACGIAA